MNATNNLVSVQIETDTHDQSDAIQAYLREAGASDIEVTDNTDKVGFLPLIPIVIAAVIGIDALVDIIRKCRIERQPEQVISYKDGKVNIRIVKGIKNGKIIILADKGTVVDVEKIPDNIDMTEVAKAALTVGADIAKEMIDKAGGKATVTQAPATGSTGN
jgi:molybdopterin/thiamine biosynthesis adenylyltransferase